MQEVDASALELWTVDEVAVKLRLSEATIWRRIYSGELDSVKVGRSRRVPPAAVAEYIAKLRGASASVSSPATVTDEPDSAVA